jgi:hypothetical protein
MEARNATTHPESFSSPDDFEVTADPMVTRTATTAVLRQRRPVARPRVLTRAQEYAFIKADMRRLIIIASSLFVLMIVLLFILD